jgi:hypothetical protein
MERNGKKEICCHGMRYMETRYLGENNGEIGGDNGERRQEGKRRLRK